MAREQRSERGRLEMEIKKQQTEEAVLCCSKYAGLCFVTGCFYRWDHQHGFCLWSSVSAYTAGQVHLKVYINWFT